MKECLIFFNALIQSPTADSPQGLSGKFANRNSLKSSDFPLGLSLGLLIYPGAWHSLLSPCYTIIVRSDTKMCCSQGLGNMR